MGQLWRPRELAGITYHSPRNAPPFRVAIRHCYSGCGFGMTGYQCGSATVMVWRLFGKPRTLYVFDGFGLGCLMVSQAWLRRGQRVSGNQDSFLGRLEGAR